MSGHHHDHSGGCHGEDHDHSNDITPAIQSLLYSQIDFDKIITLNGKSALDSKSQKLGAGHLLISDSRNYPEGRRGHRTKDLGGATKR
jgi:hypothetical protein